MTKEELDQLRYDHQNPFKCLKCGSRFRLRKHLNEHRWDHAY